MTDYFDQDAWDDWVEEDDDPESDYCEDDYGNAP